jgi:hypothetical protein
LESDVYKIYKMRHHSEKKVALKKEGDGNDKRGRCGAKVKTVVKTGETVVKKKILIPSLRVTAIGLTTATGSDIMIDQGQNPTWLNSQRLSGALLCWSLNGLWFLAQPSVGRPATAWLPVCPVTRMCREHAVPGRGRAVG